MLRKIQYHGQVNKQLKQVRHELLNPQDGAKPSEYVEKVQQILAVQSQISEIQSYLQEQSQN